MDKASSQFFRYLGSGLFQSFGARAALMPPYRSYLTAVRPSSGEACPLASEAPSPESLAATVLKKGDGREKERVLQQCKQARWAYGSETGRDWEERARERE